MVLACLRTFRCGGDAALSFVGNSIFIRGSLTVFGMSSTERTFPTELKEVLSNSERSIVRADSDCRLSKIWMLGWACSSDIVKMLSVFGDANAGGSTASAGAESFRWDWGWIGISAVGFLADKFLCWLLAGSNYRIGKKNIIRPGSKPLHPWQLLWCFMLLLRCLLQSSNKNLYFPHRSVPYQKKIALLLQEPTSRPLQCIRLFHTKINK